MKNISKYALLYTSFIILLFGTVYTTEILKDKSIDFHKNILIKQAQTHFADQVNIRDWSSSFGGVYVKANDTLKPNPYLKDNILKAEDGQVLIKVNPAWMTRQISQFIDIDDFKFRIVGLNPINPENKANDFEKRALDYLIKNNAHEYYELKENAIFNYMGALVTKPSCISCHVEQGYKVGAIEGGISIGIDTTNHNYLTLYIQEKIFYLRVIVAILLLSITLLLHKQIKDNEDLVDEISDKGKEVLSTKMLLQEVIDADHSFLMVAKGKRLILANKTMLRFFNCSSLDEFIRKHVYLSNFFIDMKNEEFLSTYIDGEHWVSYLYREQNNREIKILMKKDNKNRYFKAHSKKKIIDNKEVYIIIFDEITKELQKIKTLTEEASKDALTNLFNRGKFDDVLSKEISLAQTTKSPLCIIFLDIDHFKVVNDTYGHNVGDYILIEIANILKSAIRQGDFIARWGGEEFIITLQSTTAEQALILANKIRKIIEHYHFKNGGKQTVSIGVTQYICHESQSAFTKRVDEALYEAKETGRNRVVTK
ncbi:MAG: diguanylate cyclase [Sulfurimonas sp.]|nr:diguanylate cyclase [Sulfurimonas sp.]